MKGIILAGGHGTRLLPLTKAVNKHLLPVYDKPMIYYPLSVLIECGILDICVITKPDDEASFKKLLGFGEQWGIRLWYRWQTTPRGIADGLLVAESFVQNDTVALILGDNIFIGADQIPKAVASFEGGATIFGYESQTPYMYGVVEFDSKGKVAAIEEKPKLPKSSIIVPGLYLYDSSVVGIAEKLPPSGRGELEITDVNNAYIKLGCMDFVQLANGVQWIDAGSPEDLHWASTIVRGRQRDENRKIGCPYETAKRRDKK
jgi:glucose-1-phosphate thymidylyltransferase